ncbi:hypothetical protein EMA8858_03378 [Emticicia aquatica]|uniref:ABC transporter ATPase n=1 Tax=Emticicia aquatica TaxID=1681835 RepID=A0ABM9ATF9_9BACT|nr:hypothetical protein [Emticicia aquatica]CAH0997247.1 hypothetical protein EMA8858_03378 [Emticicia aquatica]
MYIDFDKIPQNARVWVYQVNRQLTDNEANTIESYLKPAVNQWAAHGASLLASAKVLYNRFVIIALDQSFNEASGCSIDASSRWFKELGEQLNIDFFDRSQAYFDNDEIKTFSVFQSKKTIESGLISPDTIIFNNITIATLGDLANKWQIKAIDAPTLKRFFAKNLA